MTTSKPIRRAVRHRPAGRPAPVRRQTPRSTALGVTIGFVLLTGYLATALLIALVVVTAEGTSFDPLLVLVAAMPGWLAVHQVPLSLYGGPLSVFPLVTTGLVMLLIATAASRVARRAGFQQPEQARWIVLPMALAHAACGSFLALLLGGAVDADPVWAFLHCGLIAMIAATAGVAGRCGLLRLVRQQVSPEIRAGLRIGFAALAVSVGMGAFLVLVGLLSSLPEFLGVLEAAGSAGDAFGLALLSLLYLPNAVLAGWSFAVGSGVSIGGVELSPWGAVGGEVPGVPLLVALPEGPSGWWWPAVFVLPVLLGAWMGRSCRKASTSTSRAYWALAVAVLVAVVGAGLLAGLAGGRLGGAVFDPVSLTPALLVVLMFGWISVPAAVAVWFRGVPGRALASAAGAAVERRSAAEVEPAPETGTPSETSAGEGPEGGSPDEAGKSHEAEEAVEQDAPERAAPDASAEAEVLTPESDDADDGESAAGPAEISDAGHGDAGSSDAGEQEHEEPGRDRAAEPVSGTDPAERREVADSPGSPRGE